MSCTKLPKCRFSHLTGPSVEPQPEAILGPIVIVEFETEQIILTNSNLGYNFKNGIACIKSFQFGKSVANGTGFKMEIVTETYDVMIMLINTINKSKFAAGKDAKTRCQFGWTQRNCDNATPQIITNESFGGRLKFLVQTVESTFESGIYKINVQCCDLYQRQCESMQGTSDEGSDETPMELKSALEDFWTSEDHTPFVNQVNFRSFDNNEESGQGAGFEFNPEDGGKNGPRSTWQAKEKSKLATARNWINPLTTSNGKGMLQIYDNVDILSINFQEDVIDPDPSKKKYLANFVVNGGNCSQVISFSPKINWLAQNTGTGAVDSGASSVAGVRSDVDEFSIDDWNERETIGGQQTESLSWEQNLYRPPITRARSTQDAFVQHAHATAMYEIAGPIEAELTIQGNPKFSYSFGPNGMVGKHMGILVVNPSVIREGDSGECVWIATSPCNEVLSNSAWIVKGVDHQITDGKYVTTFSVTLTVPNIQQSATKRRLGGVDDGFEVDPFEVKLGDED
jgi:hypothetical protein